MAIQDDNHAQGPIPAPEEGGARGAEDRFKQWSFHQRGLTRSPVATGYGGEYLSKIKTEIGNLIPEIADGVEAKLITLSRQAFQNLHFSALVLALRMPEVSRDTVAFHTLILEATNNELQPKQQTIDNQPVMVMQVSGDAWDEVLYRIAEEAVVAEFPNCAVYTANAEVVPRHVDPTSKEVIEFIVRNSALACVSVINQATGNFNPLNLAYLDRDCRFSMDVSFGQHQVQNIYGEPSRASVMIGYNSVMKNAGSNQNTGLVNVADATARICELAGYVRPLWSPKTPVQQLGGFGGFYGDPQDPQRFVAEFVITNVRTDFATSPSAVLLALSSMLTLSDNNTWVQAFMPSKTAQPSQAGQVDITDIGALNITANVQRETSNGNFGTPISIQAMRGEHDKIATYIYTLFQPGLVISLDVPEVGPDSWFLSVFAEAAAGDTRAYDVIYEAAQELTNNQFGEEFKHGTPMFSNISRVPLGYHMKGGQKQDIRVIDYVAVANLFQQNPQMIHDYSNTFVDRPGVSPIRNLALQENYISLALNHAIKITGYAAHTVFSTQFLTALSNSIKALGLPVSVNTPLTVDLQRAGIMAPSYVDSSLVRNTNTYGGGYQSQRPAQHHRYQNRGFGAHYPG